MDAMKDVHVALIGENKKNIEEVKSDMKNLVPCKVRL